MKKHPYLDFYLDDKGNVYDLNRNIIKQQFGEYLSIKGYHVHILVCETYLGYKKGSGNIANHKDGDKHNNNLSNLEIVDYSENITHAYKLGLRTDNNFTMVKDLFTNEVLFFHSQAECARYFNVNTSVIHNAIKQCRKGLIWRKKFLIKIANENWPEIKSEEIGKARSGFSKGLLVKDLINNTNIYYYSMTTALMSNDRLPRNLVYLLSKSKERKIMYDNLEIIFNPLNLDEIDNLIIDETRNLRPDLKNGFRKPLQVIVKKDNKTIIYPSLKDFCKEKSFKFSAVAKSVYLKKSYKEYDIEYIRPSDMKVSE